VPAHAIETGRAFARYFAGIVMDFSPKGGFWRVSQVCWGCIARKLAAMAIILMCVWLARSATLFMGPPSPLLSQMRGAIALAGGLLVLYYLVQILRDARPVLDALSRTIARHRKNARDEGIILRDIAIGTAFFLLALVLPDAVAQMQLPPFFFLADEIAFLVAFAFLWDVVRHTGEIRKRRAGGNGKR
jgi:hypothetical protein